MMKFKTLDFDGTLHSVAGQCIYPSGGKSLAVLPTSVGFYWAVTEFVNDFMAEVIIKRKLGEQLGER